MEHLTLKTDPASGATSVSNVFLDCYMPKASGEYTKVYLYLLRILQGGRQDLSVAGLADALEYTESDILRALKYWEKQRLLRLECDESNTLMGIYILQVPAPAGDTERLSVPSGEAIPEKRSYSPGELAQFAEQAEIRQLLFVCEQYMKKTLSPSEIETLLYFYDQLHFSADLIEYLVEYCVSKGSLSIHYINTVALAWAKDGIQTVSQAKERTTLYARFTFTIMKAFGINDRNPVDVDLKYINKWLKEYDFTLDLVQEACSRTMARLHKPNFEYADRILQRWADQKVHNMNDVRQLDEEHQKRAARQKPAPSQPATRFSNFEQRDYNFDELEKQLTQNS